jgi:hypothetical protein
MIRGNKEQKIKEYLLIDRMNEGLGFIRLKEGEELVGIPYGWCNDSSTPFIEHRENGIAYKTVNCADVSIIVFDV